MLVTLHVVVYAMEPLLPHKSIRLKRDVSLSAIPQVGTDVRLETERVVLRVTSCSLGDLARDRVECFENVGPYNIGGRTAQLKRAGFVEETA